MKKVLNDLKNLILNEYDFLLIRSDEHTLVFDLNQPSPIKTYVSIVSLMSTLIATSPPKVAFLTHRSNPDLGERKRSVIEYDFVKLSNNVDDIYDAFKSYLTFVEFNEIKRYKKFNPDSKNMEIKPRFAQYKYNLYGKIIECHTKPKDK
jgi:hypothetical protein